MKLGVVGLLPEDFRTISHSHLETIHSLGLATACFHGQASALFDVTTEDCQRVKQVYAEAGMEIVQFGIGYKECLFHPDASVRQEVIRKIARGIEVGKALGAHVCLIRPGSMNPNGSFAPSPKNYEVGCWERLIETLRVVADKAEQEGQTLVIETYATTIMNSPETNVAVVKAVGSERIRIVMDYVNHFQSLDQVYNSTKRINHIFDVMGEVCPVAHCKDIRVGDELALHLHEDAPGEGELDIATALRRWHTLRPNGYMLLEHLPHKRHQQPGIDPVTNLGWTPLESDPIERYRAAIHNVQRIAAEAGVPIE
jgi:sugar phosphate isomerase/epimerase